MSGYLSLVLHFHLPFVRHPEHPVFLEENWLYEAMAESYLPLLKRFSELVRDEADFKLALSISPTLCEMLGDQLLMDRFSRRLEKLVELSTSEVTRLEGHPEARAANHYLSRFSEMQSFFEDDLDRDLIGAFRKLGDSGHVELLASAATHGFLPLMKEREAVRAQIRLGVMNYRRHFKSEPKGFWLPECAFVPGLDHELAAEGLNYFILDSHGILSGTPRPKHGIFAPVYCQSGVAAFGRDMESTRQVWDARTGYPGDQVYREFYRDLGYDADMDYVGDYLHPDGIRHDLGLKYYRITGDVSLSDKQTYDPDLAQQKARDHAADFMHNRQEQCNHLAAELNHPPLIVAPYDAELFGHWWYEGPDFLAELLSSTVPGGPQLVTPSEYLERHTTLQALEPATSSWGDKGYFEVWLNGANDWIYRHLHKAEERMIELARNNADTTDPVSIRALNQAARELMLAQSSDWPFIMTTRTMVEYARTRIVSHLNRFTTLYEMLSAAAVDNEFLAVIESMDNIFPDMDFQIYSK